MSRRRLIAIGAASSLALAAAPAAAAWPVTSPARAAKVKLFSGERHDALGWALAAVGDVNGDGRQDFAAGAPLASPRGRDQAGSVYLVFGRRGRMSVRATRLGRRGVRLDGASARVEDDSYGEHAGSKLAGGGDVNGDGLDDFVISAPIASRNGRAEAGGAYVVFGRKRWPRRIDLAKRQRAGFRIDGAHGTDTSTGNTGDGAGHSVAVLGDVNGDMRADLALGTSSGRAPSTAGGTAFVVFGKRSKGRVDLARLGRRGYRIEGLAEGFPGPPPVWAAKAGDLNRDGRKDLLVGNRGADPLGRADAGAAHVIFGQRSTAPVSVGALAGRGFTISGAVAGDLAGSTVDGAGDLNGDRIPDLLVGAPGADPLGRANAGSVYAVFGPSPARDIDLANLGADGFRIDLVHPGARFCSHACGPDELPPGPTVSSAGDVNGDRRRDILVGDVDCCAVLRGLGHVLLGRRPWGPIDLASGPGTRSLLLRGTSDDPSVPVLAGMPDSNRDGTDEMLFGDPGRRLPGDRTGAAYLVPGPRKGG